MVGCSGDADGAEVVKACWSRDEVCLAAVLAASVYRIEIEFVRTKTLLIPLHPLIS